MAKKKSKRTTKSARAEIIATAKAKGWTAEQVAKRYGVSKWTYFGWRKSSGAKAAKRGRKPGRPTTGSTAAPGITPAALREEIRAVLPGVLREELSRALMSIIGRRRK